MALARRSTQKSPKSRYQIITEIYALGYISKFHEMFIRNTLIAIENFIHLLL